MYEFFFSDGVVGEEKYRTTVNSAGFGITKYISESNRGEEYNFYVGNHPLDNIPYIMSSTGFNIDVGGRFDITGGSVWMDGSYHGTGDTTFFTGENLVNLRTDKSGHGSGIYVDVDGSGPQIYSKDIYERTYSLSANMHITSYGTIGRATSATKYKLDIEEIETPDFAERILQLKPKSWYDKTATEQYADYLDTKEKGEDVDIDKIDIPPLKKHYGLVAEDLIDVGLSDYVSHDYQGEVEGIEYDRLWTLLIPIVQDLKTKLKHLKQIKQAKMEVLK